MSACEIPDVRVPAVMNDTVVIPARKATKKRAKPIARMSRGLLVKLLETNERLVLLSLEIIKILANFRTMVGLTATVPLQCPAHPSFL